MVNSGLDFLPGWNGVLDGIGGDEIDFACRDADNRDRSSQLVEQVHVSHAATTAASTAVPAIDGEKDKET